MASTIDHSTGNVSAYALNARLTLRFNDQAYVISDVTFERSYGTFRVVELYSVQDGLETFVGTLRGSYPHDPRSLAQAPCVPSWAHEPVGVRALDLLNLHHASIYA